MVRAKMQPAIMKGQIVMPASSKMIFTFVSKMRSEKSKWIVAMQNKMIVRLENKKKRR